MPNPSPHKARLAKKQRKRVGNVRDVQAVLWQAILEAEEVLNEAREPELRLRAVHAISQASGQYGRLLEVAEYEPRLKALEEAVRHYEHERQTSRTS